MEAAEIRSLTLIPSPGRGLGWSTALGLAFASDTLSITLMEIVDGAIMVFIPGATDASRIDGAHHPEDPVHYLLVYDVVDDYETRRLPLRADHLAYAQEFVEQGKLLLGGALADPVDRAVLLFEADSADLVEGFAAADPYVTHGLVTRWRVRPWTTVIGPLAARPLSGRAQE